MQGLPLDGTSIGVTTLYAIVLFLMGLCIAAAAPACNNPIFAEIVPPELRNMVGLESHAPRGFYGILHLVMPHARVFLPCNVLLQTLEPAVTPNIYTHVASWDRIGHALRRYTPLTAPLRAPLLPVERLWSGFWLRGCLASRWESPCTLHTGSGDSWRGGTWRALPCHTHAVLLRVKQQRNIWTSQSIAGCCRAGCSGYPSLLQGAAELDPQDVAVCCRVLLSWILRMLT